MKTSELIGPALNWAVAKCEGLKLYEDADLNGVNKKGWWISGRVVDPNYWVPLTMYEPSTDWAQGGPIIEREEIFIVAPYKTATSWKAYKMEWDQPERPCWLEDGPTPLIAAMRCFVASKLGDEVDVPEVYRKVGMGDS